jgi:hypothetical protein
MNKEQWLNNKKKLKYILKQPKTSYDEGMDMTLPNEEFAYDFYKIECRLSREKYVERSDALKRCQEIYGTTFNGLILSGQYWVFYSV